jgi:Response regulator containing CheY-like receiver, AAA-type ATPase, and DNA-binding domains
MFAWGNPKGPGIAQSVRGFRFAKTLEENSLALMSDVQPAPSASSPPRDSILLVDDERPILDMFSLALEPLFDVATATSAREAEFVLRKKKFKVIICDHLMPGGNGMGFLVRCREEYPHMQRILVTGYMKPEILLRSVNEAALYRYLLKPVQMADLRRIAEDAVRAHDLAVTLR